MGALQLWEKALKSDPDSNQRQTALFNCTCVHASFGDAELAQITLRDAVLEGLDFRKALESPLSLDDDAVSLTSSQQVLIKLKKFSDAAAKAAANKATAAPRTAKKITRDDLMNDDLTGVLETDMSGIDTSIFGIVKRVLVLLLILSISGVGLWFWGLSFLFPES